MTGTRRNIWINDETSRALKDIGGGNRSKGIQIAGGYHGRLKECLWHAMQCWEYDGISEEHGAVATECSNLLTEIAEAGKERN